jgi:heptosyltransferase-2
VKTRKKCLIVGPSWVGDMVMAQALYKELAANDSAIEIDVLAPTWSLPILARMDEVSRAIELPVAHGELGLAKRHAIGRSLRHEGYAQAIVLPRSFKAALVPYFARVAVRTGFRGEWRYGLINDMRLYDPDRLDQTVKRFVALGVAANEAALPALIEPKLRIDPAAQAETLERLHLASEDPVVALLPGAEYGSAKQWPAYNYAELAARLARVGMAVWILGSEKERSLGAAIADAADQAGVRNLCGETRLDEVVDLLGLTRVAVTNDSGLMHIAAAVGTHVVGIYGSSSPELTPPLTAKKHIFYRAIDCSPCFERECPLGHLRCLREISVDAVCSTVIRVLGMPRPDVASTAPAHRVGSEH